MKEIKSGKYMHFKGKIHEVIGVAKHSESLEEFVVYKHDGSLWIRPKKMFLELVERGGKITPRFKYIDKK